MGIVLVLAVAAQPLLVNASKRAKEAQLKRALRDVRTAIDAFHDDWHINDSGLCKKAPGVCRTIKSPDGYPKQLDTLLKVAYVDITRKPPPPDPDDTEEEREEKRRPKTEYRFYLRKGMLTDPITGAAWHLRCYDDAPDEEIGCGEDIYDIRTTSDGKGLDGTPYKTW
jgi:general secretion pathway protein G